MDLSAARAVHDHSDYVKWCDEGSPADPWDNEWAKKCSQYYD